MTRPIRRELFFVLCVDSVFECAGLHIAVAIGVHGLRGLGAPHNLYLCTADPLVSATQNICVLAVQTDGTISGGRTLTQRWQYCCSTRRGLVGMTRTIPTTRIEFPFHSAISRELSAPLAIETRHTEVAVATGVGAVSTGGGCASHCLCLTQGNRARIVRTRIHHKRHQGQSLTRCAFELQAPRAVESITCAGRVVDAGTRKGC